MRLLADHCDLYNAALTERREAWRMHEVRVFYGGQSASLVSLRSAVDLVGTLAAETEAAFEPVRR